MIIVRDTASLKTTIGSLVVPDTTFKCFTLEDVARALGFKIAKETAIPEGCHFCRLTYSPRFERVLPLIYNQPDFSLSDGRGVRFTGVRIHNGVNHEHTEGCILIGYEKGIDRVWKPAAYDLVKVLTEKYGLDVEFEVQIVNSQK